MNFNLKNGCQNEFKDIITNYYPANPEKEISTAIWTHDSVGVKDLTKPFLNIGIKFDNDSPSGNWAGPYWDVYVHRKTVTVSSPPCVDWYLRNAFLLTIYYFPKNLIRKDLKINTRDT